MSPRIIIPSDDALALSVGRGRVHLEEDSGPSGFGGHPTLNNGLVAYYRLDDNLADKVVLDASPAGKNGTAYLNTSVASSASGKSGRCFDNGLAGQYVDVDCLETGVGDLFAKAKAHALDCWIYLDTLPSAWSMIFSSYRSYGGGYRGVQLGIETTNKITAYYKDLTTGNGGSWKCEWTVALVAATWYHVAFLYDGTGLHSGTRIYVNGSSASSSSSTNGSTLTDFSSDQLDLLRMPIGGYTWQRKVDELGIWNRAHSVGEVSARYASGAGLFY